MNKKIKIGITIGDPSGVGPEVVGKSLKRFSLPKDCDIFVFGDEVALRKVEPKIQMSKFKIVDLKIIKESEFKFGVLSKKSGLASFTYLEKAVRFLKKGIINCLVTAPVNKKAINLNNIRFSGHTEFLAKRFGIKDFVMMFVAENLRVSLATRHIALSRVCKVLKKENVYKTIFLTYEALKNYFKVRNPRIAISGLNPHASEGGLMGKEEERVILPAVKQFKKKIKGRDKIYGPLPPDIVFQRALRKEFDAVVCMYHDQGLIPFKMLYFFEGVNFTLGLPFIRTSPDHGTAFDIAGKNKADYRSMLAAINLAYRLTKNKLGY